ncbi:hypothetical protein MLD38_003344 [Melastoma candidum]|uniref:Uncharacterized protein n=1 Tax=Melastoma candidum TaxID=119954 RepID=A0ACB9S492_9MYRT|nr:hypothetical protein MLD38_003344 [Melastoma candidum]
MYPKAKATATVTLSLTLLFTVLIVFTLLFSTVDLRSSFLPSSFRLLSPPPPPQPSSFSCSSPLRVYMYDLPRRFNVGMLRRESPASADDSPVTAGDLPPWPRNSGLKRQHSVEYWMTASLLYTDRDDGGGREAVRVSDPEEADVFFVPFFSSLSFNTHGHSMTDPDTEIDHQLQIDLLEILRNSKYWQRSGGKDHVIPVSHPNAFRFLREQTLMDLAPGFYSSGEGRCGKPREKYVLN